MKDVKSQLYTNASCDGCKKDCKFKGLVLAEKADTSVLYGCNTSK